MERGLDGGFDLRIVTASNTSAGCGDGRESDCNGQSHSTGNAMKSAMPAVTIRVQIIADESPGQPAIGRTNPSAMTEDPSQVPRCSTSRNGSRVAARLSTARDLL
jgi:hypothetical protein